MGGVNVIKTNIWEHFSHIYAQTKHFLPKVTELEFDFEIQHERDVQPLSCPVNHHCSVWGENLKHIILIFFFFGNLDL